MSKATSLFCGVLLLLLSGWSKQAAADVIEQHRYQRSVGTKISTMAWQRLSGEPERIVSEIEGEIDETEMDDNLATRTWHIRDTEKQTNLRLERQGEQITLQGTFQGEAVEEVKRIDGAPWFQTMSISFRPFLDSEQRQIRFWFVRPDTLDVYKLRAEKKGFEELRIQGQPVNAQKLELRLTGLAAPFWKAHYWFREADHLFLRYQGPGGLPGTLKIEVEISSPLTDPDLTARQKSSGAASWRQ